MIIVVLVAAEALFIIPLVMLWLKVGKRKIDEDDVHSVNAAFVIIASIINWFAYAAYTSGIIVSPTTGFFGGDLNIVGLLAAILPPLLIAVIAYFVFLLIDHIRLEWFIAKEKNKRDNINKLFR